MRNAAKPPLPSRDTLVRSLLLQRQYHCATSPIWISYVLSRDQTRHQGERSVRPLQLWHRLEWAVSLRLSPESGMVSAGRPAKNGDSLDSSIW